MANEISQFDGKVMKPLFKLLHKTGLGTPIVQLIMKGIEYYGNGAHWRGRYGTRIRWKDFKYLLLVGQSHLDAAWRWRTVQGIIKARATFKKALKHIEEIPSFTFSQPSPAYYQWMIDTDPDYITKLWPGIKEAVANKRWIPIGGSWVESDTNVPCGEALVRQRLYGQRFYLKHFGMISDVEFLQDCFGFNKNLPQIYKKSGAKLFGTGKIFWNETEKMPIGMCHWESPDGTTLPMLHIHFGYFLPINIGKKYPNIYRLGKQGRTLEADYSTPIEKIRDWQSNELMMEQAFGYGLGDGGHGPIEAELLFVRTLRRLKRKKVKYHQTGDFYAMYRKYFPRWATWKDEWYLDQHRGTYTSVTRMKRGNRETENRIIQLEKLNTLVSISLGQNKESISNSTKELTKYWKMLLYHQFHDILPGSSIPEVYFDYDDDRETILTFINSKYKEITESLLNSTKIDKEYGEPIVVFNSESWERKGLFKIDIGSNNKGGIRDENGNILSSSIVNKSWDSLYTNTKNYVILCKPESKMIDNVIIDPFECKVLYFDPNLDIPNDTKSDTFILVSNEENFKLENDFLKVLINKKTGWIDLITSKKCGKTMCFEKGANKILIFEEFKHTDAWNIDPDYEKTPVQYQETDCTITILEDTLLRKTLKITRKISKSTFIQYISLDINTDTLILSMDVDLKDIKWHVKLDYNTDIKTNIVSCEIPYVYIDRPVVPQTKLEKARWEHACQKWVSIYDEEQGIGFSLINNGKYAYNAKKTDDGITLRPTTVRSPHYTGYAGETLYVNRPKDGKGLDPNMPQHIDLEYHRDIKYGLMIHKGNWKEAKVWKKAYNMNNELHSILYDDLEVSKESSSMKKPLISEPFIKISHDSVRCSTLKFSEEEDSDEKTIIVRLVEMIGEDTTFTLNLEKYNPMNFSHIEEVDLIELGIESPICSLHRLESPKKQITIKNSYSIEISSIGGFEILTLKITLQ